MSEMVPKYFTLKNALIKKINQEEFRVNEMIPSERELISRYQVSRITVRRAIDELVREGYLYKIQGKGTFVKSDQFTQDLFQITSCSQDIERLGMKPGRKVIEQSVEKSDKKRQRLLHLADDEAVFHLERIYFANETPINFTQSYLPYAIVPGIEETDFAKVSLYKTLNERYEIKLTNAIRTIEAICANENVSEMLDIEIGMPILLFQCTTNGIVHGVERPVETFRCYYRCDRFKFYINQVGDKPAM